MAQDEQNKDEQARLEADRIYAENRKKQQDEYLADMQEDAQKKKEQVDQQALQLQQEQDAEAQESTSVPGPKAKPSWMSKIGQAVLKLAGIDEKFDEEKFFKNLEDLGLNSKMMQKTNSGYNFIQGDTTINLNTKDNTVTTNDMSEKGFGKLAKMIKAFGANELDLSKLADFKLPQFNLKEIVSNALNAAKDVGLGVVGIDKFNLDLKSDQKKAPELKKQS